MAELKEMVDVFKDKKVQSAVKNLFIYSFTILLVPLGSMFLFKTFFFEGSVNFFAVSCSFVKKNF